MTQRSPYRIVPAAVAGILACLAAAAVPAAPILLEGNFFADSVVEFQDGGFSAVLREDALLNPVLLSNYPSLGDPPLIVGGPGRRLSFNYDVQIAAPDLDEFGAFVNDAGTAVGSLEFTLDASGSGRVDFDLTAFAGRILGIEFALVSNIGDLGLGSTARISNLELTAVPVPAAAWLLVSGAGCLLGLGRRQRGGLTTH